MPDQGKAAAVLAQIRNPLVFFALALLVIEMIFGVVVTQSNLKEGYTFAAICIMAFLFLAVVGVVTIITVKWPRHLYEEIAREFEATRRMRAFIEGAAFRDTVEDIVLPLIKPECLVLAEHEADSED